MFHLLLRQYQRISRAEKRRSSKHVAHNERSECAKHFNTFARRMLDEEGKQHGVQPCFDAATAQKFFYHQDYKDFQAPQWLPEAPSPFLEGPFTLEEFEGVIKRVNVSSAPSPLDQITYRVLCQCHSLWPALLNLFNACWEQHCVPSLWKRGVIRLIPKAAANEAPHLPANLRPIALTSCVRKVYTAMLKNSSGSKQVPGRNSAKGLPTWSTWLYGTLPETINHHQGCPQVTPLPVCVLA